MVEADAIMRYIRCFSELSGGIRYAGQKRVLIETALIRLCRPEMEVKEDALLDRIRRLEQTLEKIESGALTVAAAAPMQQEPVRPSVPKAELPKAIPEDVKHIVEAWGGFWSNTPQPMKSYLKGARLSLGGDNRLLLVLEDGLASDYFLKEPANREALENMLADFAGKQVDIEIRSVQDRQEMERSYVDLSQVIHMDIEEE